MQTLTRMLFLSGWEWNSWLVLLLAAEVLALLTIPSVLLQRRGQPLAALSWALGLVAAPFLGVLGWWILGRSHLHRKRRRRSRAHQQIAPAFNALRIHGASAPVEESRLLPVRKLTLCESPGVFPTVGGNRIKILRDGQETYSALERCAREASHHIHFLFYSWAPDGVGLRFRDLLAARAREGVEVRVLCDAMGSFSLSGRFLRPLRDAGAKVAFFLPARLLRRSLTVNFRNHRKIAVFDGSLAYTGGLNLGEEYTRDWRDLGLLMTGPAVGQLQEVFAEDWYFSTGENLASALHVRGVPGGCLEELGPEGGLTASCGIIASGPDTPENATHDAFFMAATAARERIWITTPYLIPPASIQAALRGAACRRVDVRLLVPKRSDHKLSALAGRSYYGTLIASGVRIFEYLPAMLHAKVWLFDSDLSAVGSANVDTRSFKLNFESTCFIHGREASAELERTFMEGLAASEEVTRKSLEKQGSFRQLAEAAMNLLSPLL